MPGYVPLGNSPMYQISQPIGTTTFVEVDVTQIVSVTAGGPSNAFAVLTMNDGSVFTLDGVGGLISIVPEQAVLDIVTFWPRGSST